MEWHWPYWQTSGTLQSLFSEQPPPMPEGAPPGPVAPAPPLPEAGVPPLLDIAASPVSAAVFREVTVPPHAVSRQRARPTVQKSSDCRLFMGSMAAIGSAGFGAGSRRCSKVRSRFCAAHPGLRAQNRPESEHVVHAPCPEGYDKAHHVLYSSNLDAGLWRVVVHRWASTCPRQTPRSGPCTSGSAAFSDASRSLAAVATSRRR